MRCAGDFDFYQRIFLAVRPGDGFPSLDRRARQKRKVGGQVLEYHFAVFGMDVFLHDCQALVRESEGCRGERHLGILAPGRGKVP